MRALVRLVDYDASWPQKFEKERSVLAEALAQWIVGSIEHVGSTAIAGLRTKPVIDIMVPVESLGASRAALPILEQLGYEYWPYKTEVMHWLCKPSDAHRTHHLHLIPFDSQLWKERIAFRDCLRSDPIVASEYVALKDDLATRYKDDREEPDSFSRRGCQALLSSRESRFDNHPECVGCTIGQHRD